MSQQLTVGSLYSGFGGFDLGLQRAGMHVVWQCEIDPDANTLLAAQWPSVPNHGDVTLVDWSAVKRPDVLAGGFMCTDLSGAGKGAGLEGDTRSGITWREYVRALRALRPRYALVENVSRLLAGPSWDRGAWFGRVLGDMAESGYDAEWDCIPAAAVGADHLRDRVFIVAYPRHSTGRSAKPVLCREAGKDALLQVGSQSPGATGNGSALVPDAERRGLQGGILGCAKPQSVFPATDRRARGGLDFRRAWDPEPRVGRLAHELPRGLVAAALRGLGNAVVPAVAELIGGWIVQHAQREENARWT